MATEIITGKIMGGRIAEYALIGDCRTAALVSRTGSIDRLCMPRFDPAAFFAQLLGTTENGFWSISPTAECACSRKYQNGTLILDTIFGRDAGEAPSEVARP